MGNFWNPNNYNKLFNVAVFLTILGAILSVIELLTENSSSIFMTGIILIALLFIFKSRFR
jgi:membrane-bound ClpP family serine protease